MKLMLSVFICVHLWLTIKALSGNQLRKIFWLGLIVIISLGIFPSCKRHQTLPDAPSSEVRPPDEKNIQYNSYALDESVVHTLLIPAGSRFSITPALSPQLSSLESLAQKQQAIAAINGGFFDPQNQKSNSYVVRQGVLVADPSLNERMMNNRNLAPYLKKILNRTEFRQYRCGQTVRYDMTLHAELAPPGCRLVDALGGGPRLLPELTLVQEGFLDVANGKAMRDPLGNRQPNARSAVGITRDGSIFLVMVAQKPEAPTTSGMSLPALAAFMKTKGVEKAMNLDGGSSSCFYYKGKIFYGKVNEKGSRVKRHIKSVLIIQEMKGR